VSMPVLGVLGFWMVRVSRLGGRHLFRQIVVPLVLVLLPTVLWMGFYNYRLTGDPFRLAYQVHESTYGAVPIFLWQPPKAAPPYNHQTLREFHTGWAANGYRMQRSLSGWARGALWKIESLWLFYIGFLFTPFAVALPYRWHRRKIKFALGICGLLVVVSLAETGIYPHYVAPITCLVILLLVECLRQVRVVKWRGRPIGKSLVHWVLPMLLFSAIVPFALSQPLKQSGWPMERTRLLKALEERPGRQLVIVRYGPGHSPHQEWVYNRADIDAARVVWARGMNPQEDRKLLDYFKDRTVWRLQVDQFKLYLTPYPGEQSLLHSSQIIQGGDFIDQGKVSLNFPDSLSFLLNILLPDRSQAAVRHLQVSNFEGINPHNPSAGGIYGRQVAAHNQDPGIFWVPHNGTIPFHADYSVYDGQIRLKRRRDIKNRFFDPDLVQHIFGPAIETPRHYPK
jgi:hypothetical protein